MYTLNYDQFVLSLSASIPGTVFTRKQPEIVCWTSHEKANFFGLTSSSVTQYLDSARVDKHTYTGDEFDLTWSGNSSLRTLHYLSFVYRIRRSMYKKPSQPPAKSERYSFFKRIYFNTPKRKSSILAVPKMYDFQFLFQLFQNIC